MNKKLDIDLKIEFYSKEENNEKEETKKSMRLCKKYYELILHEKPDDLFLNIDEETGRECKGLYFFTKQHMAIFNWPIDKNKEIKIDIKPISKQVTNVEVNYSASKDIIKFRIYPCCEQLTLCASKQHSNKLEDIMDEFIIPNLREG